MQSSSQLDNRVTPLPVHDTMPRMIGRSTTSAGGPPSFDGAVPENGYRWWYVDGISDDGTQGIVVIGFIGSVFSPYYFRARSSGRGDPQNFCAINVGLYRRRGKLWSMTERGSAAVSRGVDWFEVGPSRLRWRRDHLEIDIVERSAPLGLPLRGRVVVHPDYLNDVGFDLDREGRHTWRPIAPSGRIVVAMRNPAIRWRGRGYADSNSGLRPLEQDFRRWNWSRGEQASETHITYAVTPAAGDERSLALRFDATGGLCTAEAPAAVALPPTGWRIRREARAAAGATVLRTLEDTPFYARSMLQQVEAGQPRLLMHESLNLERFKAPWVRTLLPFRMPRRA